MVQFNPEELHELSAMLLKCSQQQKDILRQAEGTFSKLGGSWLGPAQDAFAQQYVSMRPALIQFAGMLEAYAGTLNQAAGELEMPDLSSLRW